MSLYAFYPYRADGSPCGFQTFELPDNQSALARAREVLQDHPSSVEVIVWREELRVGVVARAGLDA